MRTLEQILARIRILEEEIVNREDELDELGCERMALLAQRTPDIRAVRQTDTALDRWLTERGR